MAPDALREDPGRFDRGRLVEIAYGDEWSDRKAPGPSAALGIVLGRPGDRGRHRARLRRVEPARGRMIDDIVAWAPGKEHESGSDEGMTAIVVEAEELDV